MRDLNPILLHVDADHFPVVDLHPEIAPGIARAAPEVENPLHSPAPRKSWHKATPVLRKTQFDMNRAAAGLIVCNLTDRSRKSRAQNAAYFRSNTPSCAIPI